MAGWALSAQSLLLGQGGKRAEINDCSAEFHMSAMMSGTKKGFDNFRAVGKVIRLNERTFTSND